MEPKIALRLRKGTHHGQREGRLYMMVTVSEKGVGLVECGTVIAAVPVLTDWNRKICVAPPGF